MVQLTQGHQNARMNGASQRFTAQLALLLLSLALEQQPARRMVAERPLQAEAAEQVLAG